MLLVVFIDLIGFGIVLPLLPFFGQHFGASPFQVTLLGATFSLFQLISAPLWGRFSDQRGRKPALYASLVTSVLAYLWMSHASALWMLFAARALQGASAGNIAVCQAYIADVTTPENRAKGMGMMGAALGFGFICGPALGGLLAGSSPTSFSVALPGYAAALFSALALMLAVSILKESLPPEHRAAKSSSKGRLAQISDAFSRPRLRILMTLFFASTFAFAGMETTFALWGHARLDWGPQQVGYVMGFVGITLVFVQGGLVRQLSKRMPEARMLLIGLVFIALGLLLLALAFHLWLALIANFCLALGMGLTSPSISALVSREASALEQGSILGVNQSVGSLARVVGPAFAGAAFNLGGPGAPYFLGCAIMLVPIYLAMGLVRHPVKA